MNEHERDYYEAEVLPHVMRGIVYGVLLSVPLWVAVIQIVRWVMA